ncbi:MAG: valine--tRNA ligase [Ruminococcaceae bacterium]|nr:valine--tRNA ligase [Oscillospiraceae bacterium]
MRELEKIYDPKQVEGKIYKSWMDGGYFRADRNSGKKPFTIVIPPPNVTGQLHLGHAFDMTIQDVLIRFKRMDGYEALWLPGYDHAGIATQIRVEEKLAGEGLTRFDLGREKFLDEVWAWKEKYGNRIIDQLKLLGSSCDWDRLRFTMDDVCAKAVREAFVNLYNKGLIYKGKRIINWCPKCTTALSDAEVEYDDKEGFLWHVRYPLSDGSGELVIATTRPETMLGDTGVAVNPDDERYKHLVGKTCILPLVGRELIIVADSYVESDFGTGCVKMTPCHDPNDFEVAMRHDLPFITVLDDNAKIINGGKYDGLDRYEARKAIVADLEAEGYLVKTEKYDHNVGTCYRCSSDVEPISSEQWFVKMQPLATEAIRVVEDKEISFVPDRFSKIYMNWMHNVRDWCISRQLWWGHRIPAWTCSDCGHLTVSKEDVTVCEACNSSNIVQDPDVLDTWFSSALWPFSTLGWPDDTEDLRHFFPTDVLVTGYDIIFFWVARMIFSSCEHTGEIPFHTVLLHGLVRDAHGKKMSKSAGNGIDPIDIIDSFGADALRFNMITGNSPGNDMRFYVERCEAMRNFANKLWNASRFVMMNLKISDNKLPRDLDIADKWVLSKLNSLISEVRDNFDKYELGIAAQKIYDFIWDTYCDWYIELSKPRLNSENEQSSETAQRVLLYVLTEILKLLHPFMPFITEEIFSALPHNEDALIIAPYPKASDDLNFPEEEAAFEIIMDAVKAVRSTRAQMNVPPSKRPKLIIHAGSPDVFLAGSEYLSKLAYAGELVISDKAPKSTDGMATAITGSAKLYMPMNELVDLEKERIRIENELIKAREGLKRQNDKLANEAFVSRAPTAVVDVEKERRDKFIALIANLEDSLKTLI